ncbi:Proteasome activator BLM10 [Stygiomarasmius scandens]|uniref:Proteasome activator BLM10 n=1 Tax=Marasmiellus scandens TaxID=2682957 RepID=A0ABR1K2P7_9AGAR
MDLINFTESDLRAFSDHRADMEDDSMSYLDTPAGDYIDQSSYDKQKSYLETYVNSVPYKCESIEDMHQRLEEIVGKIYICAKSQNWLALATWDGMLQCWLLMRYPMQKSTRAKLVRLYFELCLVPGVEPRVIRTWADMLSRLLANKSGSKRKLETTDLQLPWKPLWKALKKELWVKKRVQDTSRNVVNILLYVAEQCKRYFPKDEIPSMLDEFLPLLTQDSVLTVVPILTSFLPPTSPHLYMPALFKIWEAFNSAVLDDRLLELAGELSQEHVSGPFGDDTEDRAKWKDVGIWSETEWKMLVSKGLGSMNVPVGITRGASTTASHADSMADRQSLKIKKSISRQLALSKIIVYSIAADGPIREVGNDKSRAVKDQGYPAGSRALDTLEKLITSTESFFHPSNSGQWTGALTSFLQRLTGEFTQRWHEEQQESCKTPVTQRLTPALRRAFVNILRTPALLAMFSKDPISLGLAQGSLRAMALLEPNIIMPELLERAIGGLEVVNETHRTTAVISMLTGIARPLTTEKVWLGGQKHVLPLLELCIPGIDVNDPNKTVFTTMFIVAVLQNIKVGDLSIHQSGQPLTEDFAENMVVDEDNIQLPGGTEAGMPALSRSDERAIVRESTAAFADWVTSLFRRVLALYENLPEEGGKRNTTGGKTEEGVLKSLKNMMDVVCLHLSDQLFDLVLKLVYDYATTNAKSNAVRAFGQLIACLARVKPEKTLDKFLPFCVAQIEEELKHGASSVRMTSSHAAVPSDTTLHWNMAILRGCLGYGGPTLVKKKEQIINLILLLTDKTKSERGYSGTGQLITRVLYTLTGVYPTNSRFVNSDEWDSPEFDKDHNLHWGKFYKADEVNIEWHVPSNEEIAFVLEILDRVADPLLSKVETLLESTHSWDNAARNDFCRFLQSSRAIWAGLPTFIKEGPKEVQNHCMYEDIESLELLVPHLDVEAGFTLSDPSDSRYKKVLQARTRFGRVLHRAAMLLRQKTEGEDHIDAVMGVSKAIDVYLLDYALDKNHFDSLQKSYTSARDMNRVWPKQSENSRLAFVKRAQMYHSGRVYMHSLYRRRSVLDDQLIGELVELALSPYTRVRRHAQSVLHSVYGVYTRSTRATLPVLLSALSKGNDPDRMKGALYVLSHKGIMSYALVDQGLHQQFLLAILESQHEEKPSIQKIVNNLAHDCLTHLNEEVVHTDAYSLQTQRVDEALEELRQEFSASFIHQELLDDSLAKRPVRVANRNDLYDKTVLSILEIARRPRTHWRYVQMACRFLYGLLRRDVPFPPEVASFFLEHTISPQPSIRLCSQRAITKLLAFVKFRTYARTGQELWSEEWKNPLREDVHISDPEQFIKTFQYYSLDKQKIFVDKIGTGFLTWKPIVRAYKAGTDETRAFVYETASTPSLQVIKTSLLNGEYFKTLSGLWSQESGKTGSPVELRSENVLYMKSLAKIFEEDILDALTETMEPIICDLDRFKQRAAGEILTGLLRGSKHWQPKALDRLWAWTTNHLDRIFAQIKPDTLSFWESVFSYILEERDPRRNIPLIEWILALPLDFHADSAFETSKSLTMVEVLVDGLGPRFNSRSERYVHLLFDNANTSYAEIRAHISQILYDALKNQWQPWHQSTHAFLSACNEVTDPLRIREAKYQDRISQFLVQLPKWKEERLPPPRVSLSEYDKVGLTLLQWIWVSAYGAQACLMFPYAVAMMPEILRMSELNDSSDLQTYSTAVLYVLSAVTPVAEYVPIILENFVSAIKSSTSWRIRHQAMPALVVFFYRNLLSISPEGMAKVMDVLLDCLADENVEVREMASKVLSGVVRCSQRQRIIPLKNRFISLIRKTELPPRGDPSYAQSLRSLHSGVLGLCALIESFPYSVEPWMPSLTEVLATHVTDPVPISTTIRKCASDFKKVRILSLAKEDPLLSDHYAMCFYRRITLDSPGHMAYRPKGVR